jgi:hypothetical protein
MPSIEKLDTHRKALTLNLDLGASRRPMTDHDS